MCQAGLLTGAILVGRRFAVSILSIPNKHQNSSSLIGQGGVQATSSGLHKASTLNWMNGMVVQGVKDPWSIRLN